VMVDRTLKRAADVEGQKTFRDLKGAVWVPKRAR